MWKLLIWKNGSSGHKICFYHKMLVFEMGTDINVIKCKSLPIRINGMWSMGSEFLH